MSAHCDDMFYGRLRRISYLCCHIMYYLINIMDEKNFQLVGSELAQVVMTPKQKEYQRQREQQLAILEGLRITAEMALPPLEFLFKMNDKPCFPRGELVTVSGKPKSGKTLFLSLLMAVCTAREEVVGIARMPDTPPLKCLWYDTEQSRQSTLEILRDRIGKLADGIEDGMYDIFNCRSVDWQERLALLEAAIVQSCPDFVVIDGICDLIADINDGVSVKPVVERLMQLAQDHQCCIVCAIHQNKGAEDRNPRGWMGTELNNKSFEVYSCELIKPDIIFSVEQTLSRRFRMERLFYFVVDETGMPHPSEGPELTDDSDKEKKAYPLMDEKYLVWPDGKMDVDIRSLFHDVLKTGPRYYSELQTTAMSMLGCKKTGYWNQLFNRAKHQGIIVNDHNRQGKSVWRLAQPAATQLELPTASDEATPF